MTDWRETTRQTDEFGNPIVQMDEYGRPFCRVVDSDPFGKPTNMSPGLTTIYESPTTYTVVYGTPDQSGGQQQQVRGGGGAAGFDGSGQTERERGRRSF